jgi:hypothetical protein
MGMTGKAGASILVSQTPVNNSTSTTSETGNRQQLADNFSLGSASSVQSVNWWGAYDNGTLQSTSFEIRFYSSLTGSPVAFSAQTVSTIQVTSTAFTTTTPSTSGTTLYEFQANLPSAVSLPSGTTYISILNNPTNSNNHWSWSYLGGAGFYRIGDSGAFNTNGVNMAFELSSDLVPGTANPNATVVPTPAAFGTGLLTLAGMGVAAALRRKAKSKE